MAKVDLHNHLGRNGDNPGFDETIDVAFRRLGYGGIVGICNDGPTDYRYENFIEQKKGRYQRVNIGDSGRAVWVPEKNIVVVGVEEVEPEDGGHFLCVGMPKREKVGTRNLGRALERADEFGVAKIIVHPFGIGGFGHYLKTGEGILEEFDAYEVYNSSAALGDFVPLLGFRANCLAAKFYDERIDSRYSVGAVSFTDGHSVNVIGRAHSWVPSFSPEKREFESVLQQRLVCSKNDRNLVKEPARWDASKHALHMVEDSIKTRLFKR